MRETLESIYRASLAPIQPERLIRSGVSLQGQTLRVKGWNSIATKVGHGKSLKRIEVIEAGHPFPDSESQRAAHAVMEHCRCADERTLVIGLISGGGSALLSAPLLETDEKEGMPLKLDDKR